MKVLLPADPTFAQVLSNFPDDSALRLGGVGQANHLADHADFQEFLTDQYTRFFIPTSNLSFYGIPQHFPAGRLRFQRQWRTG